jgi:integrase
MRGVYEKDPGSGVWWIRWTDGQGKLHREKAGRRTDAKTLVEKRRTEVLQQKKLPEQYRERVTFDELCDDAEEYSKATNNAKVTHDLGLKVAKLRLVFGPRMAESITRQEIVRWLTQEADSRGWAISTRNRWQSALSLIFRVGIQNSKLEANPVSLIRQPAEHNDRIRYLTAEEEGRLIAAVCRRCPENLPTLLLSLHTGMRSGEQFSLRWNQVDFDRSQISLYRKKNSKLQYIPLNRDALDALKQIRRTSFYVFPSGRKENSSIKSPKGWFNAAVKEAQIEGYTWHCNRHTFASRLVMAGVDLRTVGELLGHKVMQMTMRYSHLAPAHKAAAVARLESGTGTGTDTGTQPTP